MKKKVFTVPLEPQQLEILEEIKADTGLSYSTIFRNALILYGQKTNPKYINKRSSLTEDEEVERNQSMVDKKAATIKKKYLNLCERLGGKVVGNTCVYNQYSRVGVFEQVLPLDHLDDGILENQFIPSRAAIEKLITDGKLKATLPNL